jgi:hypothetical protein
MPYQGVPVISVHVGSLIYFAQSIAKLKHLVVFHFEQHVYHTVAIVDYFYIAAVAAVAHCVVVVCMAAFLLLRPFFRLAFKGLQNFAEEIFT